MKKRVWLLLAGCVVIGLFWSCSKEMPVQTERKLDPVQGPGGFGMSYLKGLAKTRVASSVQAGDKVNFNLGNLKGSTAFYFLLYNIGGMPITNVKLSISDSGFAVFPSAIDTLVSGGDVGMLPVVKVSAYHGSALDGIGSRPVMKRGKNAADLMVEGTTKTNSGNDTTVRMAANLTLTALVMDIEMKGDSGRVIDLAAPNSGGQGRINGYDVYNIRGYTMNSDFTFVTIKNMGNVLISIEIYEGYDKTFVLSEEIRPDDTLSVELKTTERYVLLSGGNVVAADYRKLRMEDNGIAYLQIGKMMKSVE